MVLLPQETAKGIKNVMLPKDQLVLQQHDEGFWHSGWQIQKQGL